MCGSLEGAKNEKRVRFIEGRDQDFWSRAEQLTLQALRRYAMKHRGNGHAMARRLFVEDAEHGFAFVDLCHKRFDVALMNPPFGLFTPETLQYAKDVYPVESNDIFAAFVSRASSMLAGRGFVGVVSTRLGFFAEGLASWRRSLLGDPCSVDIVADLGYGVLDSALVEVCAYIILKGDDDNELSTFIRLLDSSTKADDLVSVTRSLERSSSSDRVFYRSRNELLSLPGHMFAYWLPQPITTAIASGDTLSKNGVVAYSGLQTDDDFRFLRLWWEVSSSAQHRWARPSVRAVSTCHSPMIFILW